MRRGAGAEYGGIKKVVKDEGRRIKVIWDGRDRKRHRKRTGTRTGGKAEIAERKLRKEKEETEGTE
eukprot:167653-Pleurochrysis_carterae.AAC.1